MRPIEFKGKRKDNGEWEYGNHLGTGKNSLELFFMNVADGIIDHETVGQFTGTDEDWLCNKLPKLYEGDLCRVEYYCLVCNDTPHILTGYVVWDENFFSWSLDCGNIRIPLSSGEISKLEIIGNIHEEQNDKDKEVSL